MNLKRGDTLTALQEADRGLQAFPSKKAEWHWRFRVLKAEVLHEQGLSRDCLFLLSAELPPFLAGSDLAIRRKLTQGAASASISQLTDADRFLAEAEALVKASHPELQGDLCLRKGTVHFIKNEMQEAEAAYRKALELARQQKDPFLEAAALCGLGVAATKDGRYDEAIDWNRAAEDLARSVNAAGTLAKTLGNLGWNHAELGDYENALTYYNQAEEASTKSHLFTDKTYWMTSIAYVYHGLGDDTRAEAILREALKLARAQDEKGTLAQCLSQLTWIALGNGRMDLAETYSREVADLEAKEFIRTLSVDAMLLRGLIAAGKQNHTEAENSFEAVLQQPQAVKYQRWKAQAELANVYAAEGRDPEAEKQYLVSLATIEEARKSIQTEGFRLFFLFNTIRFYSDFIEFLVSRNRIEDALQVAELSRARTLAEGLGAGAKTPSFPLSGFHPHMIAQRRKATLLVYWLAPERSYLWVITPAKMGFFTLAKQSEIEAQVSEYRGAMQAGKDLLSGGGLAGQKLYTMLVAPAMRMIPRDSRVIVLPDAKLYRLNFETLIASDPAPHYWIEDVVVNTASSLTLLGSAGVGQLVKQKRLLLIGNAEPNKDFQALPQAAQEMKNIEKNFPESMRRVIEGKEATATAYLHSSPEQFPYIHFVTHGTASVTHPLESAVILSPDGDSYKLYARDIVQHRINAGLVTISACNGEGTSYSGEGLVGLSWAFVRAGAHNVIGALWEVSDASTPQLMDSLYDELSQGKDPATALRDAKLAMLHSNANNVFKKPFYWAPFQLYTGP